MPAATARALFEYGPTEYWPSFTFTAQETEALNALYTDIDKYIDAMRVDLITGARPMDGWEDYMAQLDMFRTEDMLNIYQAALDRYAALTGAHK